MKTHQRAIGKSDTWLTPPGIMTNLGTFNLDPACPDYIVRPLAGCCYDKKEDGLKKKWFGRVWLNPPFNRGQRAAWMSKMADHGNGIMLVPAATETAAFFDFVWDRADAILFLKGRPHFHTANDVRSKANCGCSICLVAYGSMNRLVLRESGLPGHLVVLKGQR